MIGSDGGVDTHQELEATLHTVQELSSLVDVDVEFSLQGIVDQHAGADVDVVGLRVPGRLVGDGHTVPSVGVDLAKSLSYASDHSLGEHVGLLLHVMVVAVGVVESSKGGIDHEGRTGLNSSEVGSSQDVSQHF
eukprot:CAMPEP_0170479510 /NCGR_PEP_ID=MMETSP0208-20121228/720_1 /TAXON_ID=197538 /ORGANISM="Strombidium inclinatum, Strain S3" /LENGTH=133 /DNA_ID=CAMNT_0010751913 /DNA_START=20 /DNA_END=418 /DNA_ORIENTATION=-